MRNSLKKTAAAILLAVMALSLASCTKKEAPSMDERTYAMLCMGAEQTFSTIISMSPEDLDATIEEFEYEQNTVYTNGLNSWKSSADELGGLIGITDEKAEINADGSYKVTINADFAKRNCEFILGMDARMSDITELTFNPEYSLKEKMGQAGTNLLIGMGTVFAVLIFLTWVISLFKYIGKFQEKTQKKVKEPEEDEAPDAGSSIPEEAAGQPDHEEIQAVIAAAIAAYEEDTAKEQAEAQPVLDNGITVRSFRRGDRR